MQPPAVSRQPSGLALPRHAVSRHAVSRHAVSRHGVSRHASWCLGFTLIELLIVITIIAMGAAVVALSVSSSDARLLKEETARLGALFRIAQDEARVSGRTLVWEANLEGYRFRPLDPEAARYWKDEVLRPRAWPFAVRRVEGGRIVFGREPLLDPARLHIETAEREVRLVLDALGELREIP